MSSFAAALVALLNLGATPDAGVPRSLFEQRPAEPYDSAKGFATMLDESSLRVVRLAKRVEIIRLSGEAYNGFFTATAKPGEPNVEGFAIQRRFTTTDEGLIGRIKATVLSPASYRHYEGMKLCGGFQPKVVFRFESFGDVVDVLLCFNCEDVGVSGPRQKAAPSRYYPLADMKTDAWWALAKEVFPDDAFIQKQKPGH